MRTLSTIARGDASHIAERRRVVVRTPEEWGALWAAHAGPASETPAVNFAVSMVAAAFGGTQTPPRSIEIVGAVEEEGGTRLVVEERRAGSDPDATMQLPRAGDPDATIAGAPGVTGSMPPSPFHIVMLPRVDGEIRWTDARHTAITQPAEPIDRITRGAHSRKSATGLRPRTAGVLSYLAGPVSGVIMLVAEPEQPFVRFHAWQSVIALGAFAVVVALCYAIALVSVFFTANGLAIMVRVATVAWIGLLVLWALLMWQAWKGRAWKLPLAGRWAEALAARRITPRTPGGLNSQLPTPDSQDV
jgi:uncharacterized membrane protein